MKRIVAFNAIFHPLYWFIIFPALIYIFGLKYAPIFVLIPITITILAFLYFKIIKK